MKKINRSAERWMLAGFILIILSTTLFFALPPGNSNDGRIQPHSLRTPVALQAPVIPLSKSDVVRKLPHFDERTSSGGKPNGSNRFTEGLAFLNGKLVESVGDTPGTTHTSRLFVLNATNGGVEKVIEQPSAFGEGVAFRNASELVSLTWLKQKGTLWSWPSLSAKKNFSYQGEGWGLARGPRCLWRSDGSSHLTLISPTDLKTKAILPVTTKSTPVVNLNELAWAHGWILANIWRTSVIAVINPRNGKVAAQLDISALTPKTSILPHPDEDVANGIAFDSKNDVLYLTGKEWPWIWVVKWPSELREGPGTSEIGGTANITGKSTPETEREILSNRALTCGPVSGDFLVSAKKKSHSLSSEKKSKIAENKHSDSPSEHKRPAKGRNKEGLQQLTRNHSKPTHLVK